MERPVIVHKHDIPLLIGVVLVALVWVLGLTEIGLPVLALLLLTLAVPIGISLIFSKPEIIVYLLLVLVSFSAEYSQTQWGIRSADQLATLYNWRIIPSLTASAFDFLFAALMALWLIRKWLLRERFIWPPKFVWIPLAVSAGFTFYALIIGLFRLQLGFELYHILREFRPFLYGIVVYIVTIDIITGRFKVETLWRLVMFLAVIRGVQGIVRHYLGIGRSYYGTTMVYYDYSDTILLLAGLSFLLTWALGRRNLKLKTLVIVALAAIPIIYSFIFSYRRSFWIGSALALSLLFIFLNGREKYRYLTVAGLGVVAVLAFILVDPSDALTLVGQRIASVTDTQSDPSNYFRVLDTRNALNAVYQSAAIGMGFGSRYQVISSVYWLSDFISHVSRASHNGYLYITMKMGLLGLISWSLFWASNLAVCFILIKERYGRYRQIGLGVSVVLFACAVANLFLPLYYNLRPMILLAILSGLAIAAWHLQKQSELEPI